MGKKALSPNVTNDLQSTELIKLQNEIICKGIKPIEYQMNDLINNNNPYNKEFFEKEFYTALNRCKSKSAPGMDQISYDIIKKLPRKQLENIRRSFNCCFLQSQFPEDWRTALVKFIPKPNSKEYRPISLTSSLEKLMERMIHRRLEHFVESHDLIPRSQFGFRKEKSAIDCVSVLVLDTLRGFTLAQGTAILAQDIKGAFNALLRSKVLEQLEQSDVPARLVNFVAFMITKRYIISRKMAAQAVVG